VARSALARACGDRLPPTCLKMQATHSLYHAFRSSYVSLFARLLEHIGAGSARACGAGPPPFCLTHIYLPAIVLIELCLPRACGGDTSPSALKLGRHTLTFTLSLNLRSFASSSSHIPLRLTSAGFHSSAGRAATLKVAPRIQLRALRPPAARWYTFILLLTHPLQLV
jgi:hypothetical protein